MIAEAGEDSEPLDLSVVMATHWQAVAARMADLPIYNPALAVHATGFRRIGAWRVGVVVTPWFMNVIAVPDRDVELPGIGSKCSLALPAGEIEGVVGSIEAFGRVVSASLYSPMQAFDDADVAIAVAEAALDRLFAPPEPDPAPAPHPPIGINRRALLFPRARAEAGP